MSDVVMQKCTDFSFKCAVFYVYISSSICTFHAKYNTTFEVYCAEVRYTSNDKSNKRSLYNASLVLEMSSAFSSSGLKQSLIEGFTNT